VWNLYLKKLEIYGFKSFAERTSIEFDRGITAIVGPNGSGKSNVADAVRWVLGEQSAKSLRGSKMEDVIFSGTQQRKPLGFAEVSLTLDNSDGYLPVDFSEVTITRRVFRSGESEYYINRSPCRLKDIVELFMDTGVGKEGYSIIGQGRIEEILSTYPENRREIFEEAAGIVKYKARKEEAVRKLERTLENITRVEDILEEISKQLEPLKIQSEVAQRYLNLRDKLKLYRLNQFILRYDKYTESINQLKEQAAVLDQEITGYRQTMEGEERKYEAARAELDRISKEIQNYRDLCHELLQKIERLKGEIGILEERIQQVSKEKQRLEAEVLYEENQIEQKCKERDDILASMKKYQGDLSKALAEHAKLVEDAEELQEHLSKSRSEVENKRNSILEILNSLSQARNDITKFRTIRSNLLQREEQIKMELASLEKIRSSLSEKRSDIEAKIEDLKKEIEERTARKEDLERIKISRKNAIEDMKVKLQREKQHLEGLRSRLKVLEEMNDEYEGFQKSVKNILKFSKKDPGFGKRICGVVAELIRVPKKYELAIETALGPSLQHIVTENEEDAKYIIEFLRSRQWGRATFLPITAVKTRSLSDTEKTVLQMAGCQGIASELVDFDPKYKGIFQNLLGRVIITENLDQAVNIARHFSYSFRIVTMDGDVINPGGAITGGSSSKESTGIIGRNREIAELRQQIKQISADLEYEEKRSEDLYEQYREISNKLQELTQCIHENEIQQTANQEQAERVKQELLQITAQISKLSSEKEKIKEEISDVEKNIQQKDAEIKELEAQNSDLELLARDTEASIKEIAMQKEELDKKATEQKIHIAGLEREIAILKEKCETLNKEIEHYNLSVRNKKEQIGIEIRAVEEYKENIVEKQKEIDKMQKSVLDNNESVKGLQEEKEQKEIYIKEIEKKQKEFGELIEKAIEQKHRIEVQLSRQEVELDNLQNSIWEEYEISYANALNYRDSSLSLSKIEQGIRQLNDEIDSLGEVNINAISEYRRVKERFDFISNQRQDLLKGKDNLRTVIRDITKTMENRFRQEFKIINEYFNEVFCKLFGGGKAELILEDPENVLESGIEIVAEPPGKKLQNISLLSGGEKTLTAIAILFAILKKKPTPFCILDEIEAALDESNIHSFGRFLREFSNNTQFVVITHRRETMENSDALYGVAMEEKGISKMVSVKLEEAS